MLRISHLFWLLSAVSLAYANAFHAAFQFDDFNVIVDNPAVHSWQAWWASMPGIRPLLKLSYTFHWTRGADAVGFHVFNIVVHGVNTLLVYLLARRWMESVHGSEHPELAALLVALLFALHPAQTEAVTYISGRSVSLMAMFYLSAMVAGLHGGRGQKVASLILMMAAIATKETAWTLPFALLLWQCAEGKSWRDSAYSLKSHGLILLAAGVVMVSLPAYRRLLEGSLAVREFGPTLLAMVEGQFYLLTQSLLLLRANIDPDIVLPASPDMFWSAKAVLLLGMLIGGAWTFPRRPWLGFGILWFFLHLLPTNSLLPRADIANDRQLYLAMIGPLFLLCAGLAYWWQGRLWGAAGAILILVAGTLTVSRNHDYRTEIALWEAAVQASPNKARVWNNLGYAYQLAGDRVRAERAFRQVLNRDPENIQAQANLIALTRKQE